MLSLLLSTSRHTPQTHSPAHHVAGLRRTAAVIANVARAAHVEPADGVGIGRQQTLADDVVVDGPVSAKKLAAVAAELVIVLATTAWDAAAATTAWDAVAAAVHADAASAGRRDGQLVSLGRAKAPVALPLARDLLRREQRHLQADCNWSELFLLEREEPREQRLPRNELLWRRTSHLTAKHLSLELALQAN